MLNIEGWLAYSQPKIRKQIWKTKSQYRPEIWWFKNRPGISKREKNFHSFRHSCSTKLREATVEEYWIQQIIGHKTGRLAGVPVSTVADQYTFSPQDFESKNYDRKKAYSDKVWYDGFLDVSSPYLKSIIGNWNLVIRFCHGSESIIRVPCFVMSPTPCSGALPPLN